MTPSYLLDTDVLSDLRRQRRHPALINWLLSVDAETLFTSAVTVAEIQCGIGLVHDRSYASRMQDWLDEILRIGQPKVLDLNTRAALLLGKMWATPSLRSFIASDPRSRKVKSGADLAIAAAAIENGMVLVSRNTTDFLQIHVTFPLPGLFNPFDSYWSVQP